MPLRCISACALSVLLCACGATAGRETGPGAAGSAGCGTAHAAGLVSLTTTDKNGATRTYAVDVPTNYDPNRSYPVILVFHGAGGTGANMRQYSGFTGVPAAMAGAILVWPDGSLVAGYEGFGNGWDPSGSCGGKDLAFVENMIGALKASYCVNPARVFAAGFSWGTDFTNALACCRPALFRGILPASGDEVLNWNPACNTVGATFPAVRFTYGTADGAYSQASFASAVGVYRANLGCAATFTSAPDTANSGTCKTYDGCSKPVVECSYPGWGHAPPSNWATASWAFVSTLD